MTSTFDVSGARRGADFRAPYPRSRAGAVCLVAGGCADHGLRQRVREGRPRSAVVVLAVERLGWSPSSVLCDQFVGDGVEVVVVRHEEEQVGVFVAGGAFDLAPRFAAGPQTSGGQALDPQQFVGVF